MIIRSKHIHFNKEKFPFQQCLRRIFLLMLFVISGWANAQISFDALRQKMDWEPRYIVMNISSKTCIYCMMQQKKLEKDSELQQRLAAEVYYLPWMVEEMNGITFNQHYFETGKEFVEKFGKKQNEVLGYPLWIVFDEKSNVVYRSYGLMNNGQIGQLLDILKNERR